LSAAAARDILCLQLRGKHSQKWTIRPTCSTERSISITLYAIEADIRGRSADARKQVRADVEAEGADRGGRGAAGAGQADIVVAVAAGIRTPSHSKVLSVGW
jgi:hypothetical protein